MPLYTKRKNGLTVVVVIAITVIVASMEKSGEEKTERNKVVKKLLAKLIAKHETAEKAKALLLKNPQIKISKSFKRKDDF